MRTQIDCDQPAREALDSFVRGVSELLGSNLRGLYLGGSLARGCYQPDTSDIDLLVVIEGPLSGHKQEQMLGILQRLAKPFDLTFVTAAQLNQDRFPTPVEFLLKMNSQIVHKPEGSRDFLLQRQDLWECGIDLVGRSLELEPAPWGLLQKCIDHVFPHILPKFRNPALMLCRCVYAVRHRRLCSKQDAGRWAQTALEPRFRSLVDQDLQGYSRSTRVRLARDELRAFEDYCLDLIGHDRD